MLGVVLCVFYVVVELEVLFGGGCVDVLWLCMLLFWLGWCVLCIVLV